MDAGANIYEKLINGINVYLLRVNAQLATKALNEKLTKLGSAGVKYKLEGNLLVITEASEGSREALYEAIIDYISVFEVHYGVDALWAQLKLVILKALQNFRVSVRELRIEVPISKYVVEYIVMNTVFGVDATSFLDFRKRTWLKDPILLTNQRLIVPKGEELRNIPLHDVTTVGREVYVGYGMDTARGIVRIIDYHNREYGMSCIVVLAKDELSKEFLNALRLMRDEYKKLNEVESKVLVAIYNGVPSSGLAGYCCISQGDAEKAFNRMLQLNYSDSAGHITSYGINVSAALLQAKKEAGS
ncbi:MAG: hypothetical protein V1744_04915 [Candidatus Altiarchaeota archaeon]